MADETKNLIISEENAVAEIDVSNLPAPMDVKIAADLSGGLGEFLPFLSIAQGLSKCCQPPLSWPQGIWVLRQGKTDQWNLGPELDVFVCDWRPKAMFNDKVNNKIHAVHDHNDPVFDEYKELAEQPVEAGQERTHWWGYEFLLYHGTTGKYMTLFCNNPTLRRSAREKGFVYLHKSAFFQTKAITDKNRTWWGLDIQPLSQPFDNPIDQKELQQQIHNFRASGSTEIEDEEEIDPVSTPAVEEDERDR